MWHYQQNSTSVGPISELEIQKLVATGKLSPEDFVWYKGLHVWTKVKETALIASIPTPPPIASIPALPPPLIQRSDVPPEIYETRTVWGDDLIHFLTMLPVVLVVGAITIWFFVFLSNHPHRSASLIFGIVMISIAISKGMRSFSKWIWAMPKTNRIWMAIAVWVAILVIFLVCRPM